MLSVLLVGKDPHAFARFAFVLSQKEGITVQRAASGKEVWRVLDNRRVDVVVLDEELADAAALAFVHELIKKFPLINCAMVSSLSTKDFHEATEGLGIFMQLPVDPGAEAAAKLVQLVESIAALMGRG